MTTRKMKRFSVMDVGAYKPLVVKFFFPHLNCFASHFIGRQIVRRPTGAVCSDTDSLL